MKKKKKEKDRFRSSPLLSFLLVNATPRTQSPCPLAAAAGTSEKTAGPSSGEEEEDVSFSRNSSVVPSTAPMPRTTRRFRLRPSPPPSAPLTETSREDREIAWASLGATDRR